MSTSLVIRRKQSKTTMTYCFILINGQKFKGLSKQTFKVENNRNTSIAISGTVNWYHHSGEQFSKSQVKIVHITLREQFANFLPMIQRNTSYISIQYTQCPKQKFCHYYSSDYSNATLTICLILICSPLSYSNLFLLLTHAGYSPSLKNTSLEKFSLYICRTFNIVYKSKQSS